MGIISSRVTPIPKAPDTKPTIRVSALNTLEISLFEAPIALSMDAYLKKGLISEYWRWRREFKRKFRILPDQSLTYLEYKVLDKDRNEIDLKEEKDTSSATSKKERRRKQRTADESDD